MQKKVIIDNIKIKQDSIFNMGELYKALHSWFSNYGYDYAEEEYNETDSGKAKDLKFFWVAEKKMDAYVSWGIDLNVMIRGMEPVELERNGLKLKTFKGSIEFRITASMIKDPESKWSKGITSVLRKLYDQVMMRQRYNRMEDELVRETSKMIDEIKAFLNLYQF